MLAPKRFVETETRLHEAVAEVKLVTCPHCQRSGTLIGHGYLRGYAERAGRQVVRGRRFFCSNRYRRPGCGRTFSILLANVVARFVVRAPTLSRYLDGVVSGSSRKAAWEASSSGALSLSSGYRLWRRLRDTQTHLRTLLCRACAPPPSEETLPMAQLWSHFLRVFASAICPLSAFQEHFQTALFG